jgi:hypothetical protein
VKIFGSVGSNPRFLARIGLFSPRFLVLGSCTKGSILALAEIEGEGFDLGSKFSLKI